MPAHPLHEVADANRIAHVEPEHVVPYAEQLEKKRRDLSRLLRLDVPPLIPSPSESGFRSKVAFVFGMGQGGNPSTRRGGARTPAPGE